MFARELQAKLLIYAGDRAMTTSDGLVVPWDCLFSS